MTENSPYLSIIIPVYNVEKYLRQCVNSVLKQKIHNYEMILVDDGSSDRSPQICDEYAAEHDVIKVIHQNNAGLSAARNIGIENAKGDYIVFLDSDDWWNENARVQKILNMIKKNPNLEMVLFSGYDYVDGKGMYIRKDSRNLTMIDVSSVPNYYKSLLKSGNLQVHAATKILKRKFLIDNGLLFKNGLFSEDNEWMLRLLRCLSSVGTIDERLYVYRAKRPGSISNSIKAKNIEDLLSIVESSISYHEKHEVVEKSLKKYELCYCSYLWFSALGLSQKLSTNERRALLPKFRKTVSVCKYSSSPKTKCAYLAYKALGMKNTSLLLGIYIRLKSDTNLKLKKI